MAKKITKKSLKRNIAPKKIAGSVIKVKNAEGDSDTKATVLIQNKINFLPKVSVIIPVYNVAEYLSECLESVINQTLKEIEIICIDDGSTDNSLVILKEYAKKDKRITVMKQENLHAGIARNAGLAIARGEFLSFLDSDDFFEPNMLEKMVKVSEKDGSDLVICGNYIFNQAESKDVRKTEYSERLLKKSPFTAKDVPDDLFLMCNPNAWTKLFKAANVKKYGIRFEKFLSCNDITFVYTMMALSNKISFINDPLVHYRTNTKINISNNRGEKADCFVFAVNKLIKNLKNNKVYETFKNCLNQRIKSSFAWELKQCDEQQTKHLIAVAKEVFDKDLVRFIGAEVPKVSVIIPVYNVEKYLEQCLDSVINQSLQEIEIICVNDGSPDNSLAILQRYAKNDGRINIVNQKNQGISASRNNALEIARGEYVLFLDSDDWLDKDTCKELYNYAKKFDLDMIHFEGVNYDMETDKYYEVPGLKITYVDDHNKIYSGEEVKTFINNIPISACLVFYKKSFIKRNGILFPKGLAFEDNYFLLKALNLVKRYGVVARQFYFRRKHPGQITANWHKLFGDYIQIMYKIKELYTELGLSNTPDYGKVINRYCIGAVYRLSTFDNLTKYKYTKKLYDCIKEVASNVNLDASVLNFMKNSDQREVYKSNLLNWYKSVTGNFLNLVQPKTYNEKLQWLKLYNSTPLKTKLADKLLVRDWVQEKIGEQYLVPLLGVYNKFEDIDFSSLPDQFVIKCNHGSGWNIIVTDKSKLDLADVKAKLDKWMNNNYAYLWGYELHYRDITPKIIIEKYIDPKVSDHEIQVWTFNGEIKFVSVETIKDIEALERGVFYPDGSRAEFEISPQHYKRMEGGFSEKAFKKAVELAKSLLIDVPYVRIDFVEYGDDVVFRELTFTSGSGLSDIKPDKYNMILGNMIKLPKLAYNIDTGEYYKLKKKSKVKAYLLFPYYLYKLYSEKRKYFHLTMDKIVKQLRTFRLDIKNHGSADNELDIVADGTKIVKPAWYKNEQGQGSVVEGNSINQKLKVVIKGDGILRMSFKAPDRRYEGKRFPVYVDYESIKIDGTEVLKEPVSAWHDVPFRYEMPVKNGQVVEIIISQKLYKYEISELKDIILKLNPKSDYIISNINLFIKELSESY